MPRIDRAALDHVRFPVTVKVPTRFADLDLQGHVNNAAVPVILQESRVDFDKAVDLRSQLGRMRPMVAGITIEYAAELTHPGEIEILTGVSTVGRTSFTIQQIARQGGKTAVYAETTTVIVDSTGPSALPEGLKHNLETFLLRKTK
ncbi:MAG: acyl-CoA thioesterase [Sphingorhabdus sp.]|nr:acyl-CoA thioesterase [Sphingorhabdus sp.]